MTYIPWVLSANVVLMMWLVGNKNPLAWWIGISSQALWLYFDWRVEAWGLMPLAVVLTVVYFRNWQRWQKETQMLVLKLWYLALIVLALHALSLRLRRVRRAKRER